MFLAALFSNSNLEELSFLDFLEAALTLRINEASKNDGSFIKYLGDDRDNELGF